MESDLSVQLCEACSGSIDECKRVAELLEAGADVNCTAEHMRTPLLLALSRRHEQISQLLVWANADLTVSASDGLNALHVLAMSTTLPDAAGARLVRMLCEGHTSAQSEGLDNYGLPRVETVLESRDHECLAPLARACYDLNSLVVDALLDAGSDPNTEADDGLTPLMLCFLAPTAQGCAREEVTTIVRQLVLFGARVRDVVDSKGLDVLHHCRIAGQYDEALQLLLERQEEEQEGKHASDDEESLGSDGLPSDPLAKLALM